ncbi:MAG: (cytosine-5-)-methyltransferase [Bradyrhizobium sp.]|nr:(cytosine-5-)-methyltransferase [Bradyrhizobium sp.]
MRTVAFCEIEPFCRHVLAKHWPTVPCYEDVRTLTGGRLRADGIVPDVICGGFPCQDISFAGKGAGIDGARSGLWGEYARIIGEVRPLFVIVENVAALLGRGLDRVLGDLAALRYDAEWHCIPASAVGAPHRRDRLWIVAHPQGERRREAREHRPGHAQRSAICSEILADADCSGPPERPTFGSRLAEAIGRYPWVSVERRCEWAAEPAVGRVVDGLPDRVDPIAALGNSVVPQIPEIIGRAIMKAARC